MDYVFIQLTHDVNFRMGRMFSLQRKKFYWKNRDISAVLVSIPLKKVKLQTLEPEPAPAVPLNKVTTTLYLFRTLICVLNSRPRLLPVFPRNGLMSHQSVWKVHQWQSFADHSAVIMLMSLLNIHSG